MAQVANKLLFTVLLLLPFSDGFGSSRRYGGSYRRSYRGYHFNYYSARRSLADVLASSPSNKDPTVPEGKDPLVPTKLKVAPPSTAQIYWPSSRVFASPGAAIDAIHMVDRPKMSWNADPDSYYFIIAVDEGIPAIQVPWRILSKLCQLNI